MSYIYQDLKRKKVADLRSIAEGLQHEAVQGYLTMHKDQLLQALCTALQIDTHEHHDVKGIDKRAVKAQIRQLKGKRDEALKAHDRGSLKQIRREMHQLKRAMRKATV